MNILKEASKRVQKEVDKLSINELMNFYIKEIQKELKNIKQ